MAVAHSGLLLRNAEWGRDTTLQFTGRELFLVQYVKWNPPSPLPSLPVTPSLGARGKSLDGPVDMVSIKVRGEAGWRALEKEKERERG